MPNDLLERPAGPQIGTRRSWQTPSLSGLLGGVLQRGRFAQHVLTLMSGTVLGQGLLVIATPALTRIFDPVAFGLLAIFVAVIAIPSCIPALRYDLAIMLPDTDEEAANVMALSMLVVLFNVGISSVVVLLFGRAAARELKAPQLAVWLWAVPWAVLCAGASQVLNNWWVRHRCFHRLAMATVSQSVGTVGSQVGFGLIGLGGPAGLIIGWLIGQATASSILAQGLVRGQLRFIARNIHWRNIGRALRSYRRFPLYAAPYILITTTEVQVTAALVGHFADLRTVGLFSLARRISYLPINLVIAAMNQVFFQKLAREQKSGRLEDFVLRILSLQVYFGLPAVIFCSFEATPLFRFGFGPAWSGAGQYASLWVISSFILFATGWLDRIFDVTGYQRTALTWALGKGVIAIGAMTVTLWLWKDALLSTAVYVTLDCAGLIVYLLLAFHASRFSLQRLVGLATSTMKSAVLIACTFWAVNKIFTGMAAVGFAFVVLAVIYTVLISRSVGWNRLSFAPSE